MRRTGKRCGAGWDRWRVGKAAWGSGSWSQKGLTRAEVLAAGGEEVHDGGRDGSERQEVFPGRRGRA